MAGKRILVLFALSIARTALSNRLAKLQVHLQCPALGAPFLMQIILASIISRLATACQGCNIADVVLSLQGHLFRAAFLRHVPLFIRNLSENVVLCLAAAAVESTAKTMLAHMELRWRNSLTSRMHTPYFENMVRASFHSPKHSLTCMVMLYGV